MALHRTQLLLEPWQHAQLKAVADEQGKSMSEVLREIVEEGLASRPRRKKGVMAIAGIFHAGPLTNEEMDAIIYRKDWE